MEEFRVLDESYLPEMAELYKVSFAGEPWFDDWSDEKQLTEYIREVAFPHHSMSFGLLMDGKLIALAMGGLRHWWEGTNYNIEELCVAPEYRGQGMGTRFMSMVEDEVRKMGLSGIFLQTDSDKPSYRFYKRNGFGDLEKHVSLYKKL